MVRQFDEDHEDEEDFEEEEAISLSDSSQDVDIAVDQASAVFPSSPEIMTGSDIEEYSLYEGEPFEDPREADTEVVAKGLIQIVEVEGPMLAKRAYDIYLRHCGIKRMGKDLRKLMNQALQSVINTGGVVKNDEWNAGGLIRTIIRLSNQPELRPRTRGDRKIDEIPPSELKRASAFIHAKHNVLHSSEEHFRLILELYELKRLTSHTNEVLDIAINNQKNASTPKAVDV